MSAIPRRLLGATQAVALVNAFVVLMTVMEPSDRASAAHARAGNILTVGFSDGDVVGTYDHTDKSSVNGGSDVDWPLTLILRNNATIGKVKAILGSTYADTGSTMYMPLRDAGASIIWDDDKGRKSPNGCTVTDAHVRLYADYGDDRMYNLTDGYYVVGTTHYDINETCRATFGYSDRAEQDFCAYFSSKGKLCSANRVGVGNTEPVRKEGEHIWENDGAASYVNIP